MRFEYVSWGRRAPDGAVSCDGLVPGARLDLSHWAKNRTPAHLKRDTSVEIALAFAEERAGYDVERAVNNHFDADGVLAVWCLLRPALALEHASTVIAAAEAGDFEEWPIDERGLWLSLAIDELAAGLGDAAAYAHVLPILDTLVPEVSKREDLWGAAYHRLKKGGAWLERGAVSVEARGRLAVVRHEQGAPELPGPWLYRVLPKECERVLLAFAEPTGWRYRYELRRWSWADTVARPRLSMPRRGPIRRGLGDSWVIKGRRGLSGLAYTEVPIQLPPEAAAERLGA